MPDSAEYAGRTESDGVAEIGQVIVPEVRKPRGEAEMRMRKIEECQEIFRLWMIKLCTLTSLGLHA
jgi:hypothetical protein